MNNRASKCRASGANAYEMKKYYSTRFNFRSIVFATAAFPVVRFHSDSSFDGAHSVARLSGFIRLSDMTGKIRLQVQPIIRPRFQPRFTCLLLTDVRTASTTCSQYTTNFVKVKNQRTPHFSQCFKCVNSSTRVSIFIGVDWLLPFRKIF